MRHPCDTLYLYLFLERVFPLGNPRSPLSLSSPPRACGSSRDPFFPFLSCDPSGSLVPLASEVRSFQRSPLPPPLQRLARSLPVPLAVSFPPRS